MKGAQLKKRCLEKVILDLEDLRSELNEVRTKGSRQSPNDLNERYFTMRLDNIVLRFRILAEMDDVLWEAMGTIIAAS
ncbi:MAG TPA: hypothetical protein VMV83_05950 [Rectinemataceae bacterium]|nr:hypothetical protein [Rectinemataceae bacterium]